MLLSLQVSLCAIKNEIELHGTLEMEENFPEVPRGRRVKDTIKKSMYAGVVLACLYI